VNRGSKVLLPSTPKIASPTTTQNSKSSTRVRPKLRMMAKAASATANPSWRSAPINTATGTPRNDPLCWYHTTASSVSAAVHISAYCPTACWRRSSQLAPKPIAIASRKTLVMSGASKFRVTANTADALTTKALA